MPGIKDLWRDALRRIAATNDANVHAHVFRERDKDGEIDVAFVRDRLAAHDPNDMVHLTNYVTYLIWAKLTKDHDGENEDPFLGVSDLREFLKQHYDSTDIDAFLAGLGAATPLGNLRFWLCARANVRRQLYTHGELDCHLLQWDIEELRRKPPQSVLDDIKQAHPDKRDARRELKKWRKKKDYELRHHVGRGIPKLIQQWAMIISAQLVTGCCNCPARFYESTSLARAAETRCRHSHFFSEVNFLAALDGELPQQRATLADTFEYVVRAVVEKILMILQKTFATTMLANVFITPKGGAIRQMDWKGRIILTETGRDTPVDREVFGDVETNTVGDHPCLGCAVCECFVGDVASARKCAGHPLRYGTVDPETPGGYEGIKINICQAAHPWTGKQVICPTCGQAATEMQIKIDVFSPTNYNFSDGDWTDSFPRR